MVDHYELLSIKIQRWLKHTEIWLTKLKLILTVWNNQRTVTLFISFPFFNLNWCRNIPENISCLIRTIRLLCLYWKIMSIYLSLLKAQQIVNWINSVKFFPGVICSLIINSGSWVKPFFQHYNSVVVLYV